jgi:uncharacterized protein (TIGR02231 family)
MAGLRKILLLLLMAAAMPARGAAAGVSAVVLYPDRALVTRSEAARCGPRTPAVFAHIPPSADPASFRAAARVGTVQGLRFEARTRSQGYGAEWKALEQQIRQLERELRELHDAGARNAAATELAGRYGTVAFTLMGREMGGPNPDVKAWNGAVEAALAAQLEASAETAKLETRQRSLAPKLAELKRRQGALAAAGQRSEYVAEVIVACAGEAQGESRVELSYLVGGAGWSPAYEARLGDGGAIDLHSFATITQTTGEDWQGAHITLSTAVPRQNATPPEIAPLKVWADERPPPRKVLVSRSELQQRASAPSSAADV